MILALKKTLSIASMLVIKIIYFPAKLASQQKLARRQICPVELSSAKLVPPNCLASILTTVLIKTKFKFKDEKCNVALFTF